MTGPSAEPPPALTFAPAAAEIEALARATLARLPDRFAAALAGVALRVAELADDALLDELDIDDPYELTGCYTGRPIGDVSSLESGTLPAIIHLFRRALLDEWIETGVSLEALIAHVAIHEAGHHLGLSDAAMHALEAAAG